MKTKLQKFAKFLVGKLLYRVEFSGNENIDMSKNYVFAANHVSWVDAILIWSDIDNLGIMAKEELFKNKLIGKFLKSQGVFPIARGKKDFKQIYHAVNVIRNEKCNLLIFPEGTRRAKQKGIKAKNGATYVATATGVEIVPVHITEKITPFCKIKIKYGKPIKLSLTKEDVKNKVLLSEKTNEIMEVIYSMGDEKSVR